MGPLSGIRIIEIAGIGPGPFCAMLLSDMGAEVIRVERKGGSTPFPLKYDVLNRGRKSLAVDLKSSEGVETVLRLVESADALIEGFRPGVMERLGLGPDVCQARNERLIFGRMTGWGQDGPMSQAAGHDINYIALTGALHTMGESKPMPPLNLVGDFGGGAMFLAVGVLGALLEARTSGKGQVVDAAMTDGASYLMGMFYGLKYNGLWNNQRDNNLLDGGSHFYGTYECADGKFVAIGSIEPQFYALLRQKAGLDDPAFDDYMNPANWDSLKDKLSAVFKSKSRDEWCAIMEGTDICFAPVLDLDEAPQHPHNKSRQTFVEMDGLVQPAPAPRFSRTKAEIQGSPAQPGQHSEEILADWGFNADEISDLKEGDII